MNEKCYAMKDSFFFWVINKSIYTVMWNNKSFTLLCLVTDRYRLNDQQPEADAKKQIMMGNSCCHNSKYFGIRPVGPLAITLKVLTYSVTWSFVWH